jgi:hypothetical protein
MSNISAIRQICQSELRALDGDLYMSHIFVPFKYRDALLAFSHFYCSLLQIYSESNDTMMQLIRLQWWLDLKIDSPDVPPIISLWREAGLDEELKNKLVSAHIDEIDEPTEEGLYKLGQIFFEEAAHMVTPRLVTQETLTVLGRLGFQWEYWRRNGRNMTFDKVSEHRQDLALTLEAFNCLPQDQRKEMRPFAVLMALNSQHITAWPLERHLFIYLLTALKTAFFVKI